MANSKLERGWREGFGPVAAAMAQWRDEHPRATLTEIEDALDECLGGLRTQMLVDTVQTSAAANFAGVAATERPRCPSCDERLVSRGEEERTLTTTGGQAIRLGRGYGQCAGCGTALFPPR